MAVEREISGCLMACPVSRLKITTMGNVLAGRNAIHASGPVKHGLTGQQKGQEA